MMMIIMMMITTAETIEDDDDDDRRRRRFLSSSSSSSIAEYYYSIHEWLVSTVRGVVIVAVLVQFSFWRCLMPSLCCCFCLLLLLVLLDGHPSLCHPHQSTTMSIHKIFTLKRGQLNFSAIAPQSKVGPNSQHVINSFWILPSQEHRRRQRDSRDSQEISQEKHQESKQGR